MDAKANVLEGIKRWNAHDREGFLELFDEGITFVDEPTGHRLVGRAELGKGFYDLWTQPYPDCELKDAIVFGEGELVCMRARFVGTNTAAFHAPGLETELPATGKKIDAPFVYIAEIREGKVIRAWHYYDRLLAFEQEGVLTVEKLFASLAVT